MHDVYCNICMYTYIYIYIYIYRERERYRYTCMAPASAASRARAAPRPSSRPPLLTPWPAPDFHFLEESVVLKRRPLHEEAIQLMKKPTIFTQQPGGTGRVLRHLSVVVKLGENTGNGAEVEGCGGLLDHLHELEPRLEDRTSI